MLWVTLNPLSVLLNCRMIGLFPGYAIRELNRQPADQAMIARAVTSSAIISARKISGDC